MKAYVFPGQGSQFTGGMAKDIYESNPKAKGAADQANDIPGFRITDIMFTGTADELKTNQSYATGYLHPFGGAGIIKRYI